MTGDGEPSATGGGVGVAGCIAIPAVFVLFGFVFLWAFFNVGTKRGNPYVPLVAGAVFLIVGVVGLIVALTADRK